jgi:hypothetical protein
VDLARSVTGPSFKSLLSSHHSVSTGVGLKVEPCYTLNFLDLDVCIFPKSWKVSASTSLNRFFYTFSLLLCFMVSHKSWRVSLFFLIFFLFLFLSDWVISKGLSSSSEILLDLFCYWCPQLHFIFTLISLASRFFSFWQYWGLNSGPHASWADVPFIRFYS